MLELLSIRTIYQREIEYLNSPSKANDDASQKKALPVIKHDKAKNHYQHYATAPKGNYGVDSAI